jgi:hypothetical protein
MKSNPLLKELDNNVSMESLSVQFQAGRGKGAEKVVSQPLRTQILVGNRRAVIALSAHSQPAYVITAPWSKPRLFRALFLASRKLRFQIHSSSAPTISLLVFG